MSVEAGASRKRKRFGSVVIDIQPLKVPAFRRLWVGTAVTAIGSQLTTVAVPKQVFDLTGSSAWVGLTGAVALVPLLVFGLWGGAIADTVDRRKLLLLGNAGIAVVSALLWLQAWLNIGSVWLVLVLLALNQAFFAINMPTRSAIVARLVAPELLPAATALSGTMNMFGTIFGPMAAGALMPVLGLPTLYLIDTIALLLTLYTVWRLPALPPLSGLARRAGLRDVIDGFRYMGTQKVLLASFVVDIIAMVAGMPRALFPEMAERTFGDPPGGGLALGWLFAAIPIGSVVIGLFSGWLGRIRRQGVAVVVAICAWGAAIVGFGLAHALWLAVTFLIIGGAADMVSAIYRQSILQAAATDEMRGRMQGAFTVVVAGGPRIADVTHGWSGAAVGTAAASAGGGVLVIVLIVIAVAMLPAFWRYRAAAVVK
ncbi:MFS transporter [Amycolatopsis acidiphila]|uniref:MFS transporter n=1 Tax=Amycolatopsis acidiphila TaxID=715473 RepID=A0A558AJS4_9PSEU|nr:MFS transporter [Amycolatopsis acidiphila]TVT24516.1 MFS transporter [Amycolatopsis acidiphila]UIJ59273.1 MFS transporter [Amycolatopsis acidiphila]GHG79446.1 MFS transporter [Amycolatopsis acidiphila]